MPKVIDLPTATSMSGSDYLLMESSGGGTKKITRSNALSHIGTVLTGTAILTTVPTTARTSTHSIVLPAGVWVIIGSVRFSGTPTNNCTIECGIGFEQDGVNWGTAAFSRAYAPASVASPSLPAMATYNITSQRTVYLTAYQNSGASWGLDSGASGLRAVRIA